MPKNVVFSVYVHMCNAAYTFLWLHEILFTVKTADRIQVWGQLCIKYKVYWQNILENQVPKPFPWVCNKRPNLGVFSYYPKCNILIAVVSWLVDKLQLCSLCKMIEDILPFVFNTESPLTDVQLLRYEQNSSGCISHRSLIYSQFIFAKLSFNFNFNLVGSWDSFNPNYSIHPSTNN